MAREFEQPELNMNGAAPQLNIDLQAAPPPAQSSGIVRTAGRALAGAAIGGVAAAAGSVVAGAGVEVYEESQGGSYLDAAGKYLSYAWDSIKSAFGGATPEKPVVNLPATPAAEGLLGRTGDAVLDSFNKMGDMAKTAVPVAAAGGAAVGVASSVLGGGGQRQEYGEWTRRYNERAAQAPQIEGPAA